MSQLLSPARNLEDAVAQSLDALAAGATVAACLAYYEEYAAELAPLLQDRGRIGRRILAPAFAQRPGARTHPDA